MGRLMHRVWVVSIAISLIAACDPAPIPTGAVPTRAPASSPIVSSAPEASEPSQPSATPSASQPAAIALPAGFDAIPWADLPPSTGDEDAFTVSIGVLGKPATTTRTFSRQPDVAADGNAVILSDSRRSEIIDAVTGDTIATFDGAALELNRVPRNNLTYALFSRRFTTDVARGYLYFLSANRDGAQLRRFALDGTDETLLGVLAPDPARDPWYVDFVLTPSGDVVATACPTDVARRCRISEAHTGAAHLSRARKLPADAPRPCRLFAAGDTWLIGTNLEHCRADGGWPTFIPYMAINRSTLETKVVTAPSNIDAFATIDRRRQPLLLANLGLGFPYPNLYPPMGVVVRAGDPYFTVDPIEPRGGGALDTTENGGPEIWSIAGHGPGWTLFHGYGRSYLACALEVERSDVATCPSGPVVLETTEGTFELPPGTWGATVPPLGFPGT